MGFVGQGSFASWVSLNGSQKSSVRSGRSIKGLKEPFTALEIYGQIHETSLPYPVRYRPLCDICPTLNYITTSVQQGKSITYWSQTAFFSLSYSSYPPNTRPSPSAYNVTSGKDYAKRPGVNLADLFFSTWTNVRMNQYQGRDYEGDSSNDKSNLRAEEPIRGREDDWTDSSGQRA